jgi:hypothetical protein
MTRREARCANSAAAAMIRKFAVLWPIEMGRGTSYVTTGLVQAGPDPKDDLNRCFLS